MKRDYQEAPLSDIEPISLRPTFEVGGSTLVSRRGQARHEATRPISFSRHELNQILGLYGRQVAAGEWRDYAIDLLKDKAVFSIFRRTSEFPLYRIVKNPKLARRQGAFSVLSPSGQILKRGHELGIVLRIMERQLKLVES